MNLSRKFSVLKTILECPQKTKIVHDCMMDADALYHRMGIILAGCHDTQAWDSVLCNREENLNKTLARYDCQQNSSRSSNKDMYKNNYRCWAVRPLTAEMIDYAAGDVDSLFDLRDKQLEKVRSLPSKMFDDCNTKSAEREKFLPTKKMEVSRLVFLEYRPKKMKFLMVMCLYF
jgi:ribonuclease D